MVFCVFRGMNDLFEVFLGVFFVRREGRGGLGRFENIG